jgi:RNA polymerase-binding transcription factor DksA
MSSFYDRLRPAEMQELRERLEALRRNLAVEYEQDLERERAVPSDEAGDLADRAELELERDELHAAAETAFVRVQQIDAALDAMRQGTYGVCAAGGEPISPERLRLVPWACRCAAHQEELEAELRAAARPSASPPGRRRPFRQSPRAGRATRWQRPGSVEQPSRTRARRG